MTRRQASVWARKIEEFEIANGNDRFLVLRKEDGPRWYVAIWVACEWLNLYSKEDCKFWLTDRY